MIMNNIIIGLLVMLSIMFIIASIQLVKLFFEPFAE
jgi:hypothetical protein